MSLVKHLTKPAYLLKVENGLVFMESQPEYYFVISYNKLSKEHKRKTNRNVPTGPYKPVCHTALIQSDTGNDNKGEGNQIS